MLKALWYLIKLSIFIVLVTWVALQKGEVSISWEAYTLNMQIGTLGVLIIVMMCLGNMISKGVHAFIKMPQTIHDWHHKNRLERAYKDLSKGFSALAAGDLKGAMRSVQVAGKALEKENGVVALLKALIAKNQGDTTTASENFKFLMAEKETSFLGVRGLMVMAQEQDNIEDSLTLARVAENMHPKQPWILQNLYQCEISAKDWRGAEKTLNKGLRHNVFNKDQVISDKSAIRIALSRHHAETGNTKDAARLAHDAYNINHAYVPAVLEHIKYLKPKTIERVLKKTWGINPHPDLLEAWMAHTPTSMAQSLKWVEKLVEINSDHHLSHLAVAKQALTLNQFGVARAYLRRSEALKPSKSLYEIYAKLERAESKNVEAAQVWLDKIENLPEEEVWVCKAQGTVYQKWTPLIPPQDLFNTLIWEKPSRVRLDMNRRTLKSRDNILLPAA